MQGVERYQYATFLWRLLAAILDQFIILIPVVIIAFTIGVMIGIFIPDVSEEAIDSGANILGIVAAWLYYAFMESSSKQATFCKLICGLKVTDLNGERISFMRASFRQDCLGHDPADRLPDGPVYRTQTGLHAMTAGCLVLKRVKTVEPAQAEV